MAAQKILHISSSELKKFRDDENVTVSIDTGLDKALREWIEAGWTVKSIQETGKLNNPYTNTTRHFYVVHLEGN